MWIRRVAARVKALAYAPDGRTLYTVEGGRVSAWDIGARAPTRLFRLEGPAVANARGLDVLGGRYLRIDTTGAPVWDLVDGRVLAETEVRGHGAPVNANSTELRFISRSGELIRTNDLLLGKPRTIVRKPDGMSKLRFFSFTPDDKKVALGDDAYRYALVSVATGKAVALRSPLNRGVNDLRFTPDGSALVWHFSGLLHIRAVAGRKGPGASVSTFWRSEFALHPTAPVGAALTGVTRFTLFDLRTGEEIRTLELNLGWARRVAFAPTGLTCAVAGTTAFAVFDVDL
jgi:WD40 repeat protein